MALCSNLLCTVILLTNTIIYDAICFGYEQISLVQFKGDSRYKLRLWSHRPDKGQPVPDASNETCLD